MNRKTYERVRQGLLKKRGAALIQLEEKVTGIILDGLLSKAAAIKKDYDRCTELLPFWVEYAPLQRGHKPREKAYPWGEVGEKCIEGHLYSMLPDLFTNVRFPGIPYGHDVRFCTDEAFVQIDVKSTGPTDNPDELVCSPNQVTGDGISNSHGNMVNSKVDVCGPQRKMLFQPELAPFYIIEGNVLPCITLYIKVVYTVQDMGIQPLSHLELICVPNGLLLFDGPKLYDTAKGLFTPGKNEIRVARKRTRVKLEPLASSAAWRCMKLLYVNDKVRVVSRSFEQK